MLSMVGGSYNSYCSNSDSGVIGVIIRTTAVLAIIVIINSKHGYIRPVIGSVFASF